MAPDEPLSWREVSDMIDKKIEKKKKEKKTEKKKKEE